MPDATPTRAHLYMLWAQTSPIAIYGVSREM